MPSTNPYSAPREVNPRISATAPRSHRLLSMVTVATAAMAYATFTAILLQSTTVDQQAGRWFLANVPVMIAWTGTSYASHRLGLATGVVAFAVQVAITSAMISQGIGDFPIVLLINAVILVLMICASLPAWIYERKRQLEAHRLNQ
ncbi:MAG: hypothetical protein AAGF97_09505 [Planctomycetota bacterium]